MKYFVCFQWQLFWSNFIPIGNLSLAIKGKKDFFCFCCSVLILFLSVVLSEENNDSQQKGLSREPRLRKGEKSVHRSKWVHSLPPPRSLHSYLLLISPCPLPHWPKGYTSWYTKSNSWDTTKRIPVLSQRYQSFSLCIIIIITGILWVYWIKKGQLGDYIMYIGKCQLT